MCCDRRRWRRSSHYETPRNGRSAGGRTLVGGLLTEAHRPEVVVLEPDLACVAHPNPRHVGGDVEGYIANRMGMAERGLAATEISELNSGETVSGTHQPLAGGQVRRALAAVDEHGVDRPPGARGELDVGREGRAAHPHEARLAGRGDDLRGRDLVEAGERPVAAEVGVATPCEGDSVSWRVW